MSENKELIVSNINPNSWSSWFNYLNPYLIFRKNPQVTIKKPITQNIQKTLTDINDKVKKSDAGKFISEDLVTDVTKNINNGINTISHLRKSFTDPLSIIIAGLLSVFIYIYFANDLICQIFGLCYPAYHMYMLLSTKNKDILKNMNPIIKYFLVYTHVEIFASVLKAFGMIFSHMKLSLIFLVIYMTEYRLDWLNTSYDKIIYYDRIIYSVVKKIKTECYRVSNEINNELSDNKLPSKKQVKPEIDNSE